MRPGSDPQESEIAARGDVGAVEVVGRALPSNDQDAVRLDPSGTVAARVPGGSGRGIGEGWQSVVDGCAVPAGLVSTCPGAAVAFRPRMNALELSPGPHVIRYEVHNPVTSTVRHVTRSAVVEQGRDLVLAPVTVRADPTSTGTVLAGTYRHGRTIHVRVRTPGWTDDARPHLRTTFLVGGRAVRPLATRWRTTGTGTVLESTLPARWASRATLPMKAVLHGTSAYAGATTKAAVLTRTR